MINRKVLRTGLVVFLVFEVLGVTYLIQNSLTQNPSVPNDEPTISVASVPLVSFTAAGDFGANAITKKVLQTSAKLNPDFMLALGDFAYDEIKSESEWCDFVHTELGNTFPFQLIAGNHDVEGGSGFGNGHFERYAACLPNRIPNMIGAYGERYYFDQKHTVRIIAVSPNLKVFGTAGTYMKGGADYNWLSKTIDDAHEKKVPWVVLAMHENCITIGVHNCEIGEDILNLAVEKKVDIILQGHEHGYTRSSQLNLNATCPIISPTTPNASCVNVGQEGKYKKGMGTLLIINGTGGYVLRNIDVGRSEKLFFADWHGNNIEPTNGPSYIKANKKSLEVEYLDTEGKVQDSFSITQ